jgi:hypothetical protein
MTILNKSLRGSQFVNRLQNFFAIISVSIAMGTFLSDAAMSEGLADPANKIVLTVSGDIKKTNKNNTAVFDIAMLDEIGTITFQTSTVWTEGVQTFEGVALNRLFDALGVEGGTIKASAVNDYAVEIPVSDAVEGGPIIAIRRNGSAMSLRDKGPLWIVYPYDGSPEYQSEIIYSRSIWQLDRIEILP